MRSRLALLSLACACGLTLAAPAAVAEVPRGPKGNAFYSPPGPLPGKHGNAIWARRAPSKWGLSAAAEATLVAYKSGDVEGEPVPVTGTVMVPRGKPPRGGWPLVSWGHPTVGVADRCAPSRRPLTRWGEHERDRIRPLLNGYLRAGYAVAATDFEGLGTPGVHAYAVGRSEGRGLLDMARAARDLDRRIGRRVVLAGHSQGGHAVLWAAAIARGWTRELELLAVHAFAPIQRASALVAARESFTEPGGFTAIAALFVRALDATFEIDGRELLTQRGSDLYPQTLTKCLGALAEEDSFGGMSVAEIARDDADWQSVMDITLREVDQNQFKLRPPILVMHGSEDGTIPVALSDDLVKRFREAGTKVTYRRVAGGEHGNIVVKARKAALADARRRLR